LQLCRSSLERVNGILPANCRRKVRVLQKRGRARRARRRKNKRIQNFLQAVPQKHIFRRIPEIGFERRIHQRRRFKRGCKIESIFPMDQMPHPKFCARGPGIFPPLPDSMEFPDPFGCRAGSNLPWLLFSDIGDRMVVFDCGHCFGLMR
jgi:hypothetical protein